MRSLIVAMAVSFIASFGLSGCDPIGHDPERYVLTGNDKNLFFQRQITIDPRKDDEIIAVVKEFSRQHGMDFLLTRKSVSLGDFNVSANSSTLNIKAMQITAIGDTGVQVFAIVPKEPTARDKALVAEFVEKIESIEANAM